MADATPRAGEPFGTGNGNGEESPLSLRRRILGFVGALVLLSLLASTISLYRITEVNRLLDSINRVSVPLGRLFSQMQSDADVLKRELERSLGSSHWKDPHWRPRPIPRWIEDILENEAERLNEFLHSEREWATAEDRARWIEWADGVQKGLGQLRGDAAKLYTALEQKDETASTKIYPEWVSGVESWQRQIQWGANEYERSLRQTFSLAENRVAELRTGLELILAIIVAVSMLFLWIGERALRPLSEITRMAREITRRGLRREDKLQLPALHLSRNDEVSQLAREFHRMATALLERERTVETQKRRLQEQNKLLRDNQERLRVAENLAAVGRMSAQVAHEVRNPLHSIGLEAELAAEEAAKLGQPQLKQALQSILAGVDRLEKITENYLKLSRLSAGEKREVDIGSVLESVLATYSPVFEAQSIQVDWAREPGTNGAQALNVWGDPDLLEQVLGNLLRNSIQALENIPAGERRVRWQLGTADGSRVRVRIEDSGPGVPEEIRERLFTPFLTTRAQGTGLGLSFVKKVLEDHGGEVNYVHRADASAGERGACFELLLQGSSLFAHHGQEVSVDAHE